MGTELYRAFQLPVPDWTPLRVSDAFLDQNRYCWFATETGELRPASGYCFGSRFLGWDDRKRLRFLHEALLRTEFCKIRNRRDFWLCWLIDSCAEHTDPRQVVFREERQGEFTAFFVDHGHMFGGPNGQLHPHFISSRYLDWRIYPMPSPDSMMEFSAIEFQQMVATARIEKLWDKVKELPEEWLNHDALREFALCLDKLEKPQMLKSIHNILLNLIEEANKQYDRKRESEGDWSAFIRPRTGDVTALVPRIAV